MSHIIRVKDVSYQRLEKLGMGGYSTVYRVSDPCNRFYALKKIETGHLSEAELLLGFKREIALLKKLESESRVIKYISSEEVDRVLYVVMELGDADLDTIIHKGRKMELHTVRHYSREIFKCVQAIHRHGIVHSDLKPANFISVNGSLKLIDFGLSDTPQGNTASIYRSHAIGTLSYMAPEALIEHTMSKPNKHSVSGSSDVWACGCIIYEMLYGKRVFEGRRDIHIAITDPYTEIVCLETGQNFKVPSSFRNLVQQCLTRETSRRITVEGALSSLALTESYASVANVRGIIERAIRFGVENSIANDEEIIKFALSESAKLR